MCTNADGRTLPRNLLRSISSLPHYHVTQRNRAISALTTSELHYRSVTETASDVVITIDSKSRILAINPVVKSVFGYEPSELIVEEMLIFMPEKYRAAHKGGIARSLGREVATLHGRGFSCRAYEKMVRRSRSRYCSGPDQADREQRFTGFIRDLSDRRNTEAALIQNESYQQLGCSLDRNVA